MKFLKENRIASFLVVTLVYVIINKTNANFLSVLFLLISLMASGISQKDGFAEYKARTRMLLPIKK